MPIDFIKSSERWKSYSGLYLQEGRLAMLEIIKGLQNLSVLVVGFDIASLQFMPTHSLTDIQKTLFVLAIIILSLSIALGVRVLFKVNAFSNAAGVTYEAMSSALDNYMLTSGTQ